MNGPFSVFSNTYMGGGVQSTIDITPVSPPTPSSQPLFLSLRMHPYHLTNSSFVVVKKNDVNVIFLPFLSFFVPGRSIFFKRHVIAQQFMASRRVSERGCCSISISTQRCCLMNVVVEEEAGKDILSSFIIFF